MTRILADLSKEDVLWLDDQAAEQGKSRAQILRDAVKAYRANASRDWIVDGAGYWRYRDQDTSPDDSHSDTGQAE